MASIIHSLFGFTTVCIPVIFNRSWHFLILTSALWGWAAVIMLGHAIAKFSWKVIVNGDSFTIYRSFKKKQTYRFNDICYARKTIRLVVQDVTRFYNTPVYEVIVGESPALRSVLFSTYDNVEGHDLFIDQLNIIGKIKKDPTALG